GGGGMSGFMTGRSTANLLTRMTAILAALFFATSILLVVLSNYTRAPRSIVDEGGSLPTSPLNPAPPVVPAAPGPGAPSPAAPVVPATPSPAAPASPTPPAGPSAPLAR
ncbi:MAG: preprotein translocase subunit SecG, partial [Alphaproteobacteria bacterium]